MLSIRGVIATLVAMLPLALGQPHVPMTAAIPSKPAPIPARFVSDKGSPHDFSYYPGAKGARWDPTMPRKGHSGTVITWHYRPAGSRGRLAVPKIKEALRPLAAATGFRFERVHNVKDADLKYRWEYGFAHGDLAHGGPDFTARYPGDSGYTITDATVRFSSHNDWNLSHNEWLEMIAHETMHGLGLGHAQGRTQMMNRYVLGLTKLGNGDVSGLRTVGIWRGPVR